MSTSEIVLNLWAYVDEGTGMVYAVAGKAYSLGGTDDQKLAVLHQLAPTDYLTAPRQCLPKSFSVTDGTQTRQGFMAPSVVSANLDQAFAGVFREIEKELPPLPNFATNHHTAQRVPADPLYVLTFLIEDEAGKITPITTPEQSREFAIQQQKREYMMTLGLSAREAELMARRGLPPK